MFTACLSCSVMGEVSKANTSYPRYRFVDESLSRLDTPTYAREIEAADLDGDGDYDFLIGVAGIDYYHSGNILLVNDGYGFFSTQMSEFFPSGDDSTRGIDIADFNGDNILDYVEANRFQQDRLLLGLGNLEYTDVTSSSFPMDGSSRSRDAEIGDVDDDFDYDIHITRTAGNDDCLFYNNG